MFTATTTNPKLLRDSIDTISQLIDDGLFKLKKDGIELMAADRAMVAVVDFKIKSSAFEEYNLESEKSVGVNLLNFLTILKRINPDDKLIISLNEQENKLELNLEGRSVRKFAIPLLNITSDDVPQIGQLEFSASTELNPFVIEQGISDADVIADSVMIELSSDKIRMFAESDSSRAELNLDKGNEAMISVDAKEMVKSRYPLDYLKKMIKAAKVAENTKIYLGNDYPLKLEFRGDNVSFTFVLAPRVLEE